MEISIVDLIGWHRTKLLKQVLVSLQKAISMNKTQLMADWQQLSIMHIVNF